MKYNSQLRKKEEGGELSADEIGAKAEDLVREFGEYDPTLDLSGYQIPPIDLLESYGGERAKCKYRRINA